MQNYALWITKTYVHNISAMFSFSRVFTYYILFYAIFIIHGSGALNNSLEKSYKDFFAWATFYCNILFWRFVIGKQYKNTWCLRFQTRLPVSRIENWRVWGRLRHHQTTTAGEFIIFFFEFELMLPDFRTISDDFLLLLMLSVRNPKAVD